MAFWGKAAFITSIVGMALGGVGTIVGAVLIPVGGYATTSSESTNPTTNQTTKSEYGIGCFNYGKSWENGKEQPYYQPTDEKGNPIGYWQVMSDLHKSIGDMQSQIDKNKAQIDQAITSIKNQINSYQNQLSTKNNELAAANQNLADAKTKLQQAEASGDQTAIDTAQTDVNTCQTNVTNLEDEITNLNNNIQYAQDSLDSALAYTNGTWKEPYNPYFAAEAEVIAGAVLLPLFFLILGASIAIFFINRQKA